MPLDFSIIAAMTKLATQKAAAISADDIAVNTSILQETEPKRRVPAVLKVMGGSLLIKAAMIPVALLISGFAPWAILPLLALGGLHLASEGAEKLLGKDDKACKDHTKHEKDNSLCPDRPKSPKEVEKEKIKNALFVDGLLTAEITVLTLSIVAGAPMLTVLAVLAATGLIRTGWMYGVVAGLTNMDTAGKWLSGRKGDDIVAKAARGMGKVLDKSAPYLMKGISLVGTVALFVIGGELMLHGVPGAEHLVTSALSAVTANPLVQGMLAHVAETAAGVAVGFAAQPVMGFIEPGIEKMVNTIKKLATKIGLCKRPDDDNQPKPAALPEVQMPMGKLQATPPLTPALNNAAQKPAPEDTPVAGSIFRPLPFRV